VCGSLDTCASTSTRPGPIIQVDPATQTPVQVPPKRPPSASQVAHWITLKEEQRLDWQKKYLAQLCEADQEIRETYELITDFTTMLRERQGERLDAWLQKVEEQGPPELQNFAEAIKKSLRCSESWPHAGVEQWPDRGPGASLETLKETHVWPRPLRSPTQTSSEASLEKALSTSTYLNHQKFGRPTLRGEVWCASTTVALRQSTPSRVFSNGCVK